MPALLILWGGLTLVLVVLLIYRGTLTMHEDDQLFLDNAEAHMQKRATGTVDQDGQNHSLGEDFGGLFSRADLCNRGNFPVHEPDSIAGSKKTGNCVSTPA